MIIKDTALHKNDVLIKMLQLSASKQ